MEPLRQRHQPEGEVKGEVDDAEDGTPRKESAIQRDLVRYVDDFTDNFAGLMKSSRPILTRVDRAEPVSEMREALSKQTHRLCLKQSPRPRRRASQFEVEAEPEAEPNAKPVRALLRPQDFRSRRAGWSATRSSSSRATLRPFREDLTSATRRRSHRRMLLAWRSFRPMDEEGGLAHARITEAARRLCCAGRMCELGALNMIGHSRCVHGPIRFSATSRVWCGVAFTSSSAQSLASSAQAECYDGGVLG